jgi:DNA polymerase
MLRQTEPITSMFTPFELPSYLTEKPHILHIDFEGRCRLDIEVVGADNWARHAEALCLAYAVDDGPVQLWWPGDPVPIAFIEAARHPKWIVVAFNAAFERAVFSHILIPRFGFPEIPLQQWRCSQAMAAALALPLKLEHLADALDLIESKDKARHKLMLKMTKPRKPRKGEDPTVILWHEKPEQIEQLGQYCIQDVLTEREAYHVLYPLSGDEQELWRVDRTINERGFLIDLPLLAAEQQILAATKPAINAELTAVTGGVVNTIDQVDKLRTWLEAQSFPLPDVRAKTITTLLARDDLPAHVRRVAELRQSGAQVTKVNAFANFAALDGRIRNTLRFCAAGTRRWGGKDVQPQNFRKARITPEQLEQAAALILTGDYAQVAARFPNVLSTIADLARYMVKAAEGYAFYGGDFSGIEHRVAGWVAHETWVIEAYRKYDAITDPELKADHEPYRLLAAKLYGIPVRKIADEQRNTAKICQLAFQYGGGLGAFRKFEPHRFTDDEVRAFQRKWRNENPNIVKYWETLEKAVLQAVQNPSRKVDAGDRIHMQCNGRYLFVYLPSGGRLAYPYPRIVNTETTWGKKRQQIVFRDNNRLRWDPSKGGSGFYGGCWFENLIQAISRDILAEALKRLEYAGFSVVLHIHDEVLCEVPKDFGSLEEFHRLLVQAPAWVEELPIAAPDCWSGPRFRKLKKEKPSQT